MYYYQFTLNKTKTMIIRLLFWIPPTFIYNLIRYILRTKPVHFNLFFNIILNHISSLYEPKYIFWTPIETTFCLYEPKNIFWTPIETTFCLYEPKNIFWTPIEITFCLYEPKNIFWTPIETTFWCC